MKLPKRRANCIQNLHPILTLCCIFGVCTLTIKQNKLKLSWWKTGFCAVVIILCFLHLVVIPVVLTRSEVEEFGNYTAEDVKLDFTSPHFITKVINPTAIAIIALYYRVYAVFVLHKKLPKTGEDIQKLDATLHLPQNHYKNDEKRLIVYAIFIVTPIPLQIYANWDTASDFKKYKAFFLFDLFNNYALETTEFLFNATCYLIESRFRYICKKLQQQRHKVAVNAICKTVDTFILPEQSHDDLLTANEIQTLRVAFQKLVKLSEVVNSQYSVRLLLALGVCTFNVLTNLYMGLFGDSGSMVFDVKSMLMALLWACYYFARLVWICIACEFLCKEANAVRGSVSGALNRNWGKLTKEELWIFLEVLQTTDVKFTACGFFTIDSTLITAAVATGATYLVVLAQFHSG